MPVTGIGGFFFRSKDPEGLAKWYLDHLGVGAPEGVYIWNQEAGPTVFSPFKEDSDYFAADHRWMLNLRVTDLDSMVAAFLATGIEVCADPDWNAPEIGRFVRIHDPEGNPIELWEPASPPA
ncbi:VOC family protein [Brevundimonas diminuta]|uniref:VOC family protein n=1 Tax=Brevundimonas diminuta TaxID=293 RepID=UPI0037C93A96